MRKDSKKVSGQRRGGVYTQSGSRMPRSDEVERILAELGELSLELGLASRGVADPIARESERAQTILDECTARVAQIIKRARPTPDLLARELQALRAGLKQARLLVMQARALADEARARRDAAAETGERAGRALRRSMELRRTADPPPRDDDR
jgi:hypothetical protein